MAYYVTDKPPVFEVNGVQANVKGGDARWDNLMEVHNDNGLYTYVTKNPCFLLDWKDINDDELKGWHDEVRGQGEEVQVVLTKDDKNGWAIDRGSCSDYSFIQALVFKAGMGVHEPDPNADAVVMNPGDQVIFMEYGPPLTAHWRHHITNLRG